MDRSDLDLGERGVFVFYCFHFLPDLIPTRLTDLHKRSRTRENSLLLHKFILNSLYKYLAGSITDLLIEKDLQWIRCE